MNIDIKLKTYEQLQFEIAKLNTDIFLKDKEIERLNNIIENYEQPLKFLKNRIKQGMSIEEQHKNFIWYVESRLQELKESVK